MVSRQQYSTSPVRTNRLYKKFLSLTTRQRWKLFFVLNGSVQQRTTLALFFIAFIWIQIKRKIENWSIARFWKKNTECKNLQLGLPFIIEVNYFVKKCLCKCSSYNFFNSLQQTSFCSLKIKCMQKKLLVNRISTNTSLLFACKRIDNLLSHANEVNLETNFTKARGIEVIACLSLRIW